MGGRQGRKKLGKGKKERRKEGGKNEEKKTLTA